MMAPPFVEAERSLIGNPQGGLFAETAGGLSVSYRQIELERTGGFRIAAVGM